MKIRAVRFTLVVLMGLVLAPVASAVELSLISPATITVAPGETFTIEIALDNAPATPTNGVVADITGLAAAGAVVQSGTAAAVHFAQFCNTGGCFGTINTNNTDFYDSSDLSMGSYMAGNDVVRIISALALTNTAGTGANDPGLAGVFGQFDPLDVSIQITASTAGQHVLDLVGEYNDGAQLMSFPITSVESVTVNVPEAGTLATSLTALGAVMTVVGIRRRR